MTSIISPIPTNEQDRISTLYEFDLDYSNLEDTFRDLTSLAAKISGTEISLVNLIDSYTQWSVAKSGLDLDQMAREDSVCQYTILGDDHFEVEDLSADDRFAHKFYVNGPLNLKYYFGIPLTTKSGQNIGALCVLDTSIRKMDPEKIEMLTIIASEVISRLETIKVMQDLRSKLHIEKEISKKVAHDIRGPIAGIMGISGLITDQGEENSLDDIMDMINLIYKGSRSVLDLADEILADRSSKKISNDDFTLLILRDKLLKLYEPQAKCKEIDLIVNINTVKDTIPFSKNKLLQIIGNIISNAIKFTPLKGEVIVDLDLQSVNEQPNLKIVVSDTGMGISKEVIQSILTGTQRSSSGTSGEQGYGFGLTMVRHLIESLKGKLEINSSVGEGATFNVSIPRV